MKVGDSVRKAIDDWELGELEAAMLHACNAVDGTAAKVYTDSRNQLRFTKLLRDYYSILGPMGCPGVDLENTRWPVRVKSPTASGSKPDLADVIYSIHRCTHGHGDELPDGFALIPDAAAHKTTTTLFFEEGKVRLSDRIIFGLLAVAVMSPANIDQQVPKGYHFAFGSTAVLEINEWWGRAADFPSVSALEPTPSILLNFGDWMEEPT